MTIIINILILDFLQVPFHDRQDPRGVPGVIMIIIIIIIIILIITIIINYHYYYYY